MRALAGGRRPGVGRDPVAVTLDCRLIARLSRPMDGSFVLLPEKSSRPSAAASLALALELLIWLLCRGTALLLFPSGRPEGSPRGREGGMRGLTERGKENPFARNRHSLTWPIDMPRAMHVRLLLLAHPGCQFHLRRVASAYWQFGERPFELGGIWLSMEKSRASCISRARALTRLLLPTPKKNAGPWPAFSFPREGKIRSRDPFPSCLPSARR
jgi:hypothetical protein